MSMLDCLSTFRKAIIWGAIYPCICCHRTCFRNGVKRANPSNLQKLSIYDKAIDTTFLKENPNLFSKGSLWICHTCNLYIIKEKVPKISTMNSLKIYNRPYFLNLTEVENVLIAPRINFMKMIKLPVSRMSGIKDKIINVPIPLHVIKQTVNNLPRTLDEASVIPIMIKRKKEYLTNVFHHYIRPKRIRKAINYLMDKYPFYEKSMFDSEKLENLETICIDEIEELFGEDCYFSEPGDELLIEELDADVKSPEDKGCFNEEEVEDMEEKEYIENDAVRKHQTQVSSSSFLIPENLPGEISYKSKEQSKGSLIFAPGEGQIPTNILREKHPFVLHFPILFPNGKWGLHDGERKFKITPQQFILQRIQNLNPIFADNKPFIYTAVYYIERHQLESKMNISYMRGKIKNTEDGKLFMQTQDGFAVFDNIRGSPRYWQKLRFDMIAKLEQLGPFQFFYTLSCADKRWDENLATLIVKNCPDMMVLHYLEELENDEHILDENEDEGYNEDELDSDDDGQIDPEEKIEIIKVNEEVNDNNACNESIYWIHQKVPQTKVLDQTELCITHRYGSGFQCHRYNLKNFCADQKKKLLEENVLDITRNFDHRVKAFRKHILMAENSSMKVKYYQDRTEFQSRGKAPVLTIFQKNTIINYR